jgi:spore germination protein KB
MVLQVGVIILFLSMVIASNFAEHIEEGLEVMMYSLHLPFMVIIPLLVLIVASIRNRFKRVKDKKTKSESDTT